MFEQYFAYVWRSLLRFGATKVDAEDLAQEVFIVVHRRLVDFDTTRSLKPWLFGIARNVVRDHWRKKKRQPDAKGLVDEASQNDPAVGAMESAQVVRHALRRLPEDRRAVFIGVELDQMTVREVAQALEIPENTCGSRLRVARVEFREAVRTLTGGVP